MNAKTNRPKPRDLETLRKTVVTLAKKRVVDCDDAPKTAERYAESVAELARRTRKPAPAIRAWARRVARNGTSAQV